MFILTNCASQTYTYSGQLSDGFNIVSINTYPGNVQVVEGSQGNTYGVQAVVTADSTTYLNNAEVQFIEDPASNSFGVGVTYTPPPTNSPSSSPTKGKSSASSAATWTGIGLAGWSLMTSIIGSKWRLPVVEASNSVPITVDITLTIPSKDQNGNSYNFNFYLDAANGTIQIPSVFTLYQSACAFDYVSYGNLSNIPQPSGNVACPKCCSGNGVCTPTGCTCQSGYTGLGCETSLPSYLTNGQGLPTILFTVSETINRGNIIYVTLQDLVGNHLGLYYNHQANNTWFLLSSSVRDIVLSENGDYIYAAADNDLYLLNETTTTLVIIPNYPYPVNTPIEYALSPNAIITELGTSTSILIYLFYPNNMTWVNTNFQFTNVVTTESSLIIGESGEFYFATTYSGYFRLQNGVWSKVVNEIAPYVFNLENSNPSISQVTLSKNPVSINTTWTYVRKGLPIWYTSNGIVSVGGFLFIGISNSPVDGVYQFDGERWYFRIGSPSVFGITKIIEVGGQLYAEGQDSLWRLVLAENDPVHQKTVWVHSGVFLSTDNQGYDIYAGNNTIYIHKLINGSPNIYELAFGSDYNTATFTDLNFPNSNFFKITNLGEDAATNVWLETYSNGIYKYHRSNSSWTQVNPTSGYLSFGLLGDVYLSYEIGSTSELVTYFNYTEVNEQPVWQQFQIDKGFSVRCYPLNNGPVFCEAGWFPNYSLYKTKKWISEPLYSGLNIDANEFPYQGCQSIGSTGTVIICDHIYLLDGITHKRVVAIQPDLNGEYYDANLEITTGTFLCNGNGTSTSVKILSNGNILASYDCGDTTIGGVQVTSLFGSNPTTDSGRLVILSSDGTKVISAYSIGKTILDLDTSKTSNSNSIILGTSDGIFDIDISTTTLNWQYNYSSSFKRVSYSTNHVAAILDNDVIAVFDESTGKLLWNVTADRAYTEDILISSSEDLVIYGGFDNKFLPSGEPIQVAYLDAYSISTQAFVWQRFGFSGSVLSNNVADSRIYYIDIGSDGNIYILGDTAGTETIFRYNGTAYEGDVFVSDIDVFTDLTNTAGAAISYQARLNFEGTLLGAQLTMARLPDGLSNTFEVGGISGDVNGNLHIVGTSAAFYANRPGTTINSIPVGQYHGDPVYLGISADFQNRNTWVSFIRDDPSVSQGNNGGNMKAIDVQGTTVVVMGDINAAGTAAITSNAIISTNNAVYNNNNNPATVYIAVFQARN